MESVHKLPAFPGKTRAITYRLGPGLKGQTRGSLRSAAVSGSPWAGYK